MVKRTFIVIGLILGGLGLAGSLLMLLTGANGASPVVAIVWGVILAVSIYADHKTRNTASEDSYIEGDAATEDLNKKLTVIFESDTTRKAKHDQAYAAINDTSLPVNKKQEMWDNFKHDVSSKD